MILEGIMGSEILNAFKGIGSASGHGESAGE
jgi:hypothetical protein